MSDARAQMTNADWKVRVLCDHAMVRECERLKSDANKKKSLVLRKRRKLDLGRARAILRGDLDALKAAWPGEYTSLEMGSEEHQLQAAMFF